MTERFRFLPSAVAAAAMLIALFAGATIAAEQAGAAICKTRCAPPPEEEVPGEELPPAPQPPSRTMLVIGVGWEANDPTTNSPLEPGRQASYMSYLRGHFNEWLAQQIQPLAFKKWEVTNGGEYTIATPDFPEMVRRDPDHPEIITCTGPNSGLFLDQIWARAEAKARQSGFNPEDYAVTVVQWGKTVCSLGGVQQGRHILLTSERFVPHEFGHYFGLKHPGLLRCKDANGVRVALSESCAVFSLADDYDTMGYSAGSDEMAYSAIHANYLGWMTGQFFDIAAAESARTFFLRPFTDPAHTQRALRLKDGDTTLWLEYRTELGVDDDDFSGQKFQPEQGLVIRRELPGGVSELLDMTPGSVIVEKKDGQPEVNDESDYTDAPLPVGKTWANPLGEMKITVNSASAAGVSVTIAPRRVAAPNQTGLLPSQVGPALQGAGLLSGGMSGTPDYTCNNIGRVVAQYPYPGTRVFPGSAVSFTIGEQPPFCQ